MELSLQKKLILVMKIFDRHFRHKIVTNLSQICDGIVIEINFSDRHLFVMDL